MDKLDLLLDKLGVMIDKFNIIVEQKETPKCDKTLNEWIVDWRSLYKEKKIAQSTLYMYDILHKRYIEKSIGLLKLSELKAVDLQKFINDIDAPRQREKLYVMLNDCLSRAVRNDLIEKNPMTVVEYKKEKKKLSVALTREEQKRFVRRAEKDKYCDLFMIMLYAGLRKGECVALTSQDIKLDEKLIVVNKSQNQFGVIGKPKTETSIRNVPILPELLPYVEKYGCGRELGDFAIGHTCIQTHFARIRKDAGLDNKGITIHSLRHTFATRCAENGVPPKIVQKWMGHSTLDMTMRIYTHVNKDYEQEVIEKLENTINKKTERKK